MIFLCSALKREVDDCMRNEHRIRWLLRWSCLVSTCAYFITEHRTEKIILICWAVQKLWAVKVSFAFGNQHARMIDGCQGKRIHFSPEIDMKIAHKKIKLFIRSEYENKNEVKICDLWLYGRQLMVTVESGHQNTSCIATGQQWSVSEKWKWQRTQGCLVFLELPWFSQVLQWKNYSDWSTGCKC